MRRIAIEIGQAVEDADEKLFGPGRAGDIFHEQECPVTGRYGEVEKEVSVYGGGDIRMVYSVPKLFDRCLDCGASGLRRFRLRFEDGREEKIERVFKKRTL